MTQATQLSAPIRATLQVEGAALAAAALWLYADGDHSWWLFGLLILAPDLAMIGYVRGPRPGALCYNLAHSYLSALALVGIGLWTGTDWAIAAGLIWTTHIGLDRALGYGLKYTTGFNDSHLGRV